MQEKKLQQTLLRAWKSPLYRDSWRTVGIHPKRIHSLKDLSLLPFITGKELFGATRTKRNIACCSVNTWFAGSGQTSPYEWVPFSARDFLGMAPMLARMSRAVGLRTGDVVLSVTDPPPRISYAIPYLWGYSKAYGVPRLEFITGSLDWYDTLGMTWINFVQRRRPTILFTSIKNAFALADKIYKDSKVLAKEVLTKTRVGIFYGEPLVDYQGELMERYTLTSYEAYSPTEHMSFCTECGAHLGIHLWMDRGIPEIILADCEDAVPIWEASPGSIGELVITNFAEGLPLIRYRTGESIRVEVTDHCACGRTHPRISRLPSDNNMQT